MSYNKNNIFAKILRGEIPCDKVYENDHVLAFKDINPQKKVHVLVIPKGEYVDLDDFNNNVMQEADENFGVLDLHRSTRSRQDVKRLTFTQVGHLDQKHIIFHQSTCETLEYLMCKATAIGNMLDEIEYVLSTGVYMDEAFCGGDQISLGQQLIFEKI